MELLAEMAAVAGELLLAAGLVLTSDLEVDVLAAVVLHDGVAGEGGGGEGEDAGGGEAGEVHFDGVDGFEEVVEDEIELFCWLFLWIED